MPPTATMHTGTRPIATDELKPNAFSLSVYGDSSGVIHDLVESIRVHGILVPLVVTPEASGWEVLSGHRRLACAARWACARSPARCGHSAPGSRDSGRSSSTTASVARRSAS